MLDGMMRLCQIIILILPEVQGSVLEEEPVVWKPQGLQVMHRVLAEWANVRILPEIGRFGRSSEKGGH